MHTGENEQSLRKILDMTRLISIAVLGLHCYYYCYGAFRQWGLTSLITDRLLEHLAHTALFRSFQTAKVFALAMLGISLLGVQGKKERHVSYRRAAGVLALGAGLYFFSAWVWRFSGDTTGSALLYITLTLTGFLLVLTGGTLLSRILKQRVYTGDLFNKDAETFPQEERLLYNAYSINLPAQYCLKGHPRKSWINIINPFRGLLVLGAPGSGKSYFVIRHVITQHIQKGFALFVYDFKFDDLSRIAYNTWLRCQRIYNVSPAFYVINFDVLARSHRCNPLDPAGMLDLTDAGESARTILIGLNREWIKRQGDFFVESAINFLTAVIWFLRKYRDGAFCTLPHAIELMQTDYDTLFSVLRTETEIEVLINPFISAYLNDAMEQLEGQVAAAKVAMARLSSPQLYYVLSGNDFSLDINNPEQPKLVCMGNNPQKIGIYGAVLSLYVNRLIKLVNRSGGVPSSLVFDEFPTLYINNIDSLIATARSNRVATTLGVQDLSQLRKDYGREQADVIMNITGNIISGQVMGDTARQLSERVGRILQDRTSYNVNRTDTSVTYTRQLESALPPSRIAALSSGEFVGMVADNPDAKIELKAFHCRIVQNTDASKEPGNREMPLIRQVDAAMVQRNYLQIKQEVQDMVHAEMQRMLNDPALAHLVILK